MNDLSATYSQRACICHNPQRWRNWWQRGGYDLPAFEKLTTLKTWAKQGPPKGTLYHYPNPHKHQILDLGIAGATEGRSVDLRPRRH